MATVASTQTASRDWLFTAPVDIAAFLGSAVVSLLLLAAGAWTGVLHDDTPEWAWVPFILLVDVAHVWATGFRVYFDRQELMRRPGLYFGAPVIGWILGVALYSEGETLFWRALAYLAVFHFVRQQYGWVMLYRARALERGRLSYWIDASAIYLATLYPLVYWHTHLPRRFAWFVEDDFAAIPEVVSQVAAPLYASAMAAYAVKAVVEARQGFWRWGKHTVVVTTAVCWYVGIVAFNSDYAFTVTNVVIHGVPYLVLIYWYVRRRQRDAGAYITRSPATTIVMVLGAVWLCAYAEELVWDRAVWQERSWLFGPPWSLERWRPWLVPLLAVPQGTHYILDGFIWKRRHNPRWS